MAKRYETPDEVLEAFTSPDGSIDVRRLAESLCVIQHDLSAMEYEMIEELTMARAEIIQLRGQVNRLKSDRACTTDECP